MQIQMLDERVQELEKKLNKKIKHNEALTKRVVGLMRKEREEKMEWAEKEEASRSKEATKDMVSRWSDRGQGCSKDVRCWSR
jgi:phage gpG-like protein